jgi:large subunit ribosomal protein L18
MAVVDVKSRAVRRKRHVRKRVFGTNNMPRLSVFRSVRHMYAQVVDDIAAVTLASASTMSKPAKSKLKKGTKTEAARAVGETIAKQALNMGIKCVCFDRGPYKYHGRVKALAEAARKAGLVF